MDPDQTLSEIRALVREATEGGLDAGHAERLVTELAERVEALDNWLTNRGFLPLAWSRTGLHPGDTL